MSKVRLFVWTAAMVAAGALLPLVAQILGFQLAGSLWNGLRLSAPWLSQAGLLIGGLLGGALLGLLQWAVLPGVRARWIAISAPAGLFVAVVYLVYHPLTVIAVPVAGAFAAVLQANLLPHARERWVRAQSIALAWVALALLLPFPPWAADGFVLGAALLSAWGIRSAFAPAA